MSAPLIDGRTTNIRPARSEDVATIAEVERRMTNANVTISPWDEDRIRETIRNGSSAVGQHGPFLMGFIIGHWHPKAATVEILRMGVDPFYRRRGIGSKILGDLLHRTAIFRNTNPIRRVICCVPESELDTLCPWLARRSFTESKYDAKSGLVRMTAKVQHIIHKGAVS